MTQHSCAIENGITNVRTASDLGDPKLKMANGKWKMENLLNQARLVQLY
jgi:hypothetical protein